MKKFSFISLVFLLVLQSLIGPLATASADSDQNFTAIVTVDEAGKAKIEWDFTAGNEEKDKEYTFQIPSDSKVETVQNGDLEIDGKPIGSYSLSVDGVITVTILDGQTQSGSGVNEITVAVNKAPEEISELSPPPSNAVGQEIIENLITSVKMYDARPIINEANGSIAPQGNEIQDVRPKVKDEVAIIFDWSLPNNTHQYVDGSTYTFSLPKEFNIPNELKGQLTGGVGEYVVTPSREVTFVFNDAIKGEQLEGNFYVWVAFDQSNLGEGLEHPIDFSSVGQGVIDVHFANTAVDELTKTGEANRNNFNSDEIKWTVDFNQGEKEIKGATLDDTFPPDLKLKGNIEIRQLQIQLDGSVKEGPVSRTETAFPINFGDIDKAYRVTYTTSVAAPTEAPFTNREFKNSVTLTGNDGQYTESDIGKVTVSFNEPLSKSGQDSAYNSTTQTITWKVQYNYNQQTISQPNAWIKDRFDTTKQKLVDNSVKVYQVDIDNNGKATNRTLVDSNEYTIGKVASGPDAGFNLQFKDDINKAYEIEYQTQAINRIYKDETVSNTVEIGDGTTKTGEKGINEVIFEKSVSKSNFQNKTIEWRIVLNQDLKDMTDVVITDNYEGKHMKLDPNSLKITGANSEDFVLEATNAGDPDYEKGFTIRLKSGVTINSLHEIKYTTTFDPTAGMPTNNEYRNKATLNWNEAGTPQTPITKDAVVTPKDYTINNGNKKGEYSAKDKTITWTIDVNYNLYDIKDAVIKDTYTDNQTFVENSLTVNKLELQGANNVTDIGDEVPLTNGQFKLNTDGKGFVLNLGNIGKTAFRITYKTSLDGNYPIQDKYSNHATMQDGEGGSFLFEKSVDVTPKHGGVYVDKSGRQEGQSDIASWTVNINPSQSYVLAGSILTDTLSDNQILLQDSLKLYKTDLPGDNLGNVSNKGDLVDKDDYELVVMGNTFTLTFKKSLNTAYILEYKSFINADSGDRITNKVEFAGQSSSVKGEGNQEGVKISLAGAGGGASSGSGKIKIVKVDDLDRPLKGVKFELYNSSGTTLLETLTTDEKGEVETSRNYRYKDKSGLPYKLKEVSTPTGYLIAPEYGAATGKEIKFIDPKEPFKITNKILRQGFELSKVDSVDPTKKLIGAVFELKLNGTLIDTLTTGIDGKIAEGDLAPGDYQLVEITAPDYYTLDATPIPVRIVANQTEVLILTKENVLGSDGKLVVTKVNAKDHSVLLEGVEFELHDSTNAVIAKKTTDVNGVIEFTNLPYGSYTLVETKADGYVIEKAETEVSIKQPETTLTIENKENDRSVKLTKFNSIKSQKLQRAVFELRVETEIFDKDGNFVYKVVAGIDESKLTTDTNGELFLENLEPNKYQLVEIKAPFGYLLDKTPVAFEITGKQTETVLVEKTNNKISTPVDPNVPTEPGNPGSPGNPGEPGTPVVPNPNPNPPVVPNPNPNPPVEPKPEKPVIPIEKVVTPKETPIKGEVKVPKDSTPKISKEPKHGTVSVNPNGSWVYTPDEGYVGKDSFTIIVTDQDGNEEEVLVEVDVEDVPRGGTDGTSEKPGTKTHSKTGESLPKTGELGHLPLQLTGFSFIILGAMLLLLRRKHLQNK
ncbi:collagen binding domain-containing protein [Paenibacillus sp. IHBB 10380]|uniref:collagen binding domain-containing protein n=1 Tax=Paenibacillus sp. IHBB 10380 TaxID=1566358 RepID=UPI0006975C95|nr:collagen binding domain-containing protein [Paenibacillus sp. IHBB 10380]